MSAANAIVLLLTVAACSKPDAAPPPTPTVATAVASAISPPPARPGFAKRRALINQGKAAAGTGDWDSCGRLFEQAHAWIEAARCLVHTRDRARALDDLRRGLARGPHDIEKIEADTELAALHGEPRWRSVIAEATALQTKYRSTVNPELEKLVAAESTGTEAYVFASRRGQVADILAAGGANGADDFVHAAAVYYRADTADDAARAHALALQALERDPDSDEARWLAAASEDRQLKHAGKPQKYGTQFVTTGGKRSLWNVDPAISDAERARWSVPSLAEAIAGDAETAEPGPVRDAGVTR